MSNDLDMGQYLDLFVQEADEQLEILEQETLKLEQDPSQDRLQIIFRAAHTLKGSSRAMGFQKMAELTHEMENVLDNLRQGNLSVTTPIANALLNCLDTLCDMTTSIRNGNGDAVENPSLVQELQSFVGVAPAEDEAGAPLDVSSSGFASGLPADMADALREAAVQGTIYRGQFTLSADCVLKYVRAFMVTSLIENVGELLVCVPDREALEEEKFDRNFEVFFQVSSDFEDLKTQLEGVSEVDWQSVAPWDGEVGTSEEDESPSEKAAEAVVEATPSTVASTPAAPAAAPTTRAATNEVRKTESGQTVRVDVSRLDTLMNLVGELVIDRTRMAQLGAELSATYDHPCIEALAETVGHIARTTSDLQDQIMKARMMPIETVMNRFPRVVRDLAQKLGKDVKLELVGGDTELDRSVIEVIGDPLLHILRNSVDHGLEMPEQRLAAGKPVEGKVVVSARHQENYIVIEITDDGRGIDANKIKAKVFESGLATKESLDRMTEREILQFIFASGLSTASEVSEVSGRGVGMDIVRSNIQKLGGIIDLETELGAGTKFSLRLPLTLAIIRGLLVKVSGVVYVIPLGNVIETLQITDDQIQHVNKQEVIVIRGMTTPLMRMRQVFQSRDFVEKQESEQLYVVIVGIAEQRFGLVVDRLIGEQEVVIKSLSRFCGDARGISGATILGDGNVALIMDINGLVK